MPVKFLIMLQGVHRFAGVTVEYPDVSGVGHRFVYSDEYQAHIYDGRLLDADEFNKVAPDIFGSATEFWKPIPVAIAPKKKKEPAPEPAVEKIDTGPVARRCSPPVRKFAEAAGVDLDEVTPTGKNGFILKRDVEEFLESQPVGASGVENLAVHG